MAFEDDDDSLRVKEENATEAAKLAMVLNALRKVEQAIAELSIDSIEVSNFSEVKAHFHNELIAVIKAVKGIKIPTQVSVSNFPKVAPIKIPDTVKVSNLSELRDIFSALKTAIEAIKVNPQVTVTAPEVIIPELKAPTVTVPAPIVNVEPVVEIDMSGVLDALKPLKFLSASANKPISVRLSDGQKFLKAMKEVIDTQQKTMYAFAQSSGLSKDEYKEAEKELYKSSTATNTSSTVGLATGVISAAKNRISIILVNDSDTVIYVAKGGTAELNKGIRLNASGGSVIIEDWNGAIAAISSVADKNICICEVT